MAGLRPATVDGLRGRFHLVHVATLSVTVKAGRERVHRALRDNAEGRGGVLERAVVLERSGDRLLCDFWTRIPMPGGRAVRFCTRETVEFDPPLAVHYRHRSGPSRGLAETITIRPVGSSASRVTYRAVYPSPWRWWGPIFAFFAGPVAHLFMRAHFRELREVVEPRQAGGRSRRRPRQLRG